MARRNRTPEENCGGKRFCPCTTKDMTTGDIEAHVRDIYGVEVPDTTISRITDIILPTVKEWQQ